MDQCSSIPKFTTVHGRMKTNFDPGHVSNWSNWCMWISSTNRAADCDIKPLKSDGNFGLWLTQILCCRPSSCNATGQGAKMLGHNCIPKNWAKYQPHCQQKIPTVTHFDPHIYIYICHQIISPKDECTVDWVQNQQSPSNNWTNKELDTVNSSPSYSHHNPTTSKYIPPCVVVIPMFDVTDLTITAVIRPFWGWWWRWWWRWWWWWWWWWFSQS